MNIERLEMVQVMLERMIAGSWVAIEQLSGDEKPRYSKHVDKPIEIKEFDLSSWRHVISNPADPNVCGFTACVIGHACFDEEFRKLGWSWNDSTPVFKNQTDWRAVNSFFGFTGNRDYGVGELLFTDDAYNEYNEQLGEWERMTGDDRRHVINRIDELIQLGESEFLKKHKKLLEYVENA